MWINCILKVLASESTRCMSHHCKLRIKDNLLEDNLCPVLCRVCSLVNWTLLCSERAAGHIWVQIVELYSPLHWLPALGLGWFDANMFGCLCICSTFINQIASLFLFTITLDFFCRSKTTPLVTSQSPLMGLRTLISPCSYFCTMCV